MVGLGKFLGSNVITKELTSLALSYSNKKLEQQILGINFPNPIGLAAGFDKDAQLTAILPSVGFGFAEVGSITGEPCEGNPKPRLWRLKKSKGLVVYYGLKNEGCQKISQKLRQKVFRIPIGISIAKTNSQKTVSIEAGVEDYAKAFGSFTGIGDYFTINISCPNTYGGQPFTEPRRLEKLLRRIDRIQTKKPIFLKISPDLTKVETDAILEVAARHNIAGFVCTNLTKQRSGNKIKDEFIPTKGGISGKVVEELANNLISYIYQKTQERFIIIGCGGVFSAEDAYKKIKLGASLIQLITGMVFEGPQIISEINQGLTQLIERDRFRNIAQAVGSEA
ncbi:MAG: dihydroorotate dehydrogenase (quinone) [Candidatus Woykebacteria bacterium RBG_16_44_10]|uniref:Dihydroorotate dehydrogenase (quinone) n=1 Tax=Candidatus Woykebacteria bacterium RBG_16_44_10 TaxID=1802597 RepID=A0A1G1WE61_9BACT|nr:MAG: dihydroorotate dehydrogenase (quinone) [Candidatus Woykebacteria bacterium RBG_16_44_10]